MSYRAEAPSSANTFTLLNDDYTPVTLTSVGSGSIYLVISRSFSIGFTNQWTGDFSTVSTGQGIYFGSDYLLPITTPTIDNGATEFYLRVLTSSTAEVFATLAEAQGKLPIGYVTVGSGGSGYTAPSVSVTTTTGSGATFSVNLVGGVITNISVTNGGDGYQATDTLVITDSTGSGASATLTLSQAGLVTISQLGTGQAYFAVQSSATAVPLNNQFSLSSLQYLTNGMTVQFSTTGSLPAPLSTATSYTILITGQYVQLYDATGVNFITITGLGVGNIVTQVIRTVIPVAPTSLAFANATFETGTAVIPRANPGDILDPVLTAGNTYYTRLLSTGGVQLYYTQGEATNLGSTTGLLTFSTIGNTSSSFFFLDALLDPTLVKSILHIEKPLTQGYISLYAYDYGRSNDMALIGQYHPTEVNPKYRRIRVGKACSWARIIYRVKHPTITSVYDYLPVEQPRSILTALHAIDLEDKDFVDQAQKYWQMAFGYLRNQQSSMDGHAMEPIQVNGITYGDKTDPIIECTYGFW